MRTARDDLVLKMPSFGNSDITIISLAILIQTLSCSFTRFDLPLWRFSIQSDKSARFYARGKMLKNRFCTKKCLFILVLLQKQLSNVWDFNDARRILNDYQMSWKFISWLKTNVLGSAIQNINVLIKMVYERANNEKIEIFSLQKQRSIFLHSGRK